MYQKSKYQKGKYQKGQYQKGKYLMGMYQKGKYQLGKYQKGKYQISKYQKGDYQNSLTVIGFWKRNIFYSVRSSVWGNIVKKVSGQPNQSHDPNGNVLKAVIFQC